MKKNAIITLLIVSVFVAAILTSALVMFVPRKFERLIPNNNIASIECEKMVNEDREYAYFELQPEKYDDFFNLIKDIKYVKQNYFTLKPMLGPNKITIFYEDGRKIAFRSTNIGFYDKDGNIIKKFNHDLYPRGISQPVFQLFDQEITQEG